MAERPRDTRAQQAAEREDQMRDRFGLVPGGEGRPGVDAVLPLGAGPDLVLEQPAETPAGGAPRTIEVPFELKSSDLDPDRPGAASVSTARDVGREHIAKWRTRHWLFGFYRRGTRNPPIAEEYIYASPRQLEPWIAEQELYVLPDWEIVRRLPTLTDRALLSAVAGDHESYTLEDAKRILKWQKLEAGEHMTLEMRSALQQAGLGEPRRMTPVVYRALMDQHGRFSPERMLILLRERARYLLDRGATRNNPHIPRQRLLQLVPSDQAISAGAGRWSQRLEELVRRELSASAADTETATE